MAVTLKVYVNEDDALLFWSIPAPIAGCRGFAIERRLTAASGESKQGYLSNRIGFEHEDAPAEKAQGQPAVTQPSTQWPFQAFSWTDHEADTGDTVAYRVVPVIRNAQGQLETAEAEASAWSEAKTLGNVEHGAYQGFFNRGFVISQFVSRYLQEHNMTLEQFKQTISDEHDQTIRGFLAGDLKRALLKELQTARDEGTEVYISMFELGDEEILEAVCALGGKAHLVLANGAVSTKTGEHVDVARTRDENAAARSTLLASSVNVGKDSRFIAPGALGHNKFMIRMDKTGQPAAVWTGSTNWASTGLCTQVNNGLLITDPDVAQVYLDQWKRLYEAGSDFPDSLLEANSQPKHVGIDAPGNVRSTIWFTRTKKGADLEALTAAVQGAKSGILFLMFMPGLKGVLSLVSQRAAEPGMYVRGVVSELPSGYADQSKANVNLISGQKTSSTTFDIIEPEGIKHSMAHFAAEVTHNQFLSQIGHAIIHSKVLVIDPFSDDPTVITGSHNFSGTASSKNDENFIIVKGDKKLAEAYAVNINGVYEHYRWRAFLGTTDNPFNGLQDSDAWQAPKLASDETELRFWGV
ncbi:MAG TPA: phospholipase D-like domain-containing protein [Herpetosiphonaceae bacterium]|nr:phospholipase D-like domain-containing protein [Herpetosiphonaceae bacterium]